MTERLTGRFAVALPPDEAFVLFTPQGEREWVAGPTRALDAGTVTLTLHPAGPGATEVEVTYELTALTEHGREHLATLAAGYPTHLNGWRTSIEAALTARGAGARR